MVTYFGFNKSGEFLAQWSEYELLKKESAPWS
jgi:hypothetical protein